MGNNLSNHFYLLQQPTPRFAFVTVPFKKEKKVRLTGNRAFTKINLTEEKQSG
jgi:hypothetical protein